VSLVIDGQSWVERPGATARFGKGPARCATLTCIDNGIGAVTGMLSITCAIMLCIYGAEYR
jgi:hypothetical protein